MHKNPVIYFVQQGPDGPIKIGRTKHVMSRLDAIANSNSCEVFVRALVPGSLELERQLHERFAKHRIRGEWFHPHPLLLDYIASLPNVLLRDLKYRRKYRKPLSLEEAKAIWDDPNISATHARILIGWHPTKIRDTFGSKRPISFQGRKSAENGQQNTGKPHQDYTPEQKAAAKAIWRDLVEYPTWPAARAALKKIVSTKGVPFSTDRARRLWKVRKPRR